MRRRLTVAMLVLVAVTLVVTTVTSYYFIQRAALSTAQQELSGQVRAISRTVTRDRTITRLRFFREFKVIGEAGAFEDVGLLSLHPDGSLTGRLPAGLTLGQLDVGRLEAGRQSSGHTRSLIYTAIATPIATVTATTPVLVITRKVRDPATGFRYFALVGAIVLVIAALVAAGLARRFTRPLVAAVDATHRIASGDLDVAVPVRPREVPELARLAEAINTMGANLVRARDQERQFLLSVSHELRTPLTSIRGYSDAVIDGTTDDPLAAATVISAEARRLDRLVRDLLDLARLDADRFSLDVQVVDCADAVRQVADGFRPRADTLGIDLDVASGVTEPVWVRADFDRLVQVLANLVENASSFADRRIAVGADGAGDVRTVWVEDDGPGIPSDQLSRVFERHFVSDRVSGRRTGSGLGLAIVSELVTAMGAAVRAESPARQGRGTKMVVSFAPEPAPPATIDDGGVHGDRTIGDTEDPVPRDGDHRAHRR